MTRVLGYSAALVLVFAIGCTGEFLAGGFEDDVAESDGLGPSSSGLSTPEIEGELIPEEIDRQTLDLVRSAIEMGLQAGKGLVVEGINRELAMSGIDHSYVGGESMTDIPDDVVSSCPYVENASNDGTTSVSCRLLAERARDHAYVLETDTLSSIELGEEFSDARELHQMWLENGLTSGIEGQFLMAVRRLREALVCDQAPSPVESSREQGVAIGREVFESALEEQLAVTPITECDIDNGIVNPALNVALARADGAYDGNPLCEGYAPEGADDRAAFLQAQNEYRAGIRAGVEEGAVIGAEQLFRTWVCQTPEERDGGGDGGGGGGDPLVLDLDGDGVRTTRLSRGVNFALGESVLHRTTWIADPDDGILAIDHNGNGRIDNGRELLGDMSWAPDGLSEANGLLALARYDGADLGGNGDGIIDARDRVFEALVVWRDRDRDGQTDAGELSSLSQLSIESISLTYVAGDGTLDAQFERVDGSVGAAVDVWLQYI